MAAAEVVKQALLVYSFAPIDNSRHLERSGWEYLRAQWQACAALGMTEPMAGGTPTSFPAAQPEPGSLRLLAFVRHPSETKLYSAFLFAEHDVAGLVVAIAPNDGDPQMRSWDQILRAWQRCVGGMAPAGLLGEVIVLTGLSGKAGLVGQIFGAGAETVNRSVRRACIGAIGGPWESLAVTASRLRVYGFAQADPSSRSQTYCLVASQSAEVALDEWAWAREGYWGLAPFTRLCLHAAKLRYEEALHRSAKSVSDTSSEIDTAVEGILQIAGRWTAASPVRAHDLLAADTRLQLLLQQRQGLDWSVTKLRDLRETVEIALGNIRRYIPEIVATASDPEDPFTRILDRATHLARQINHDIRYLENLLERARKAHDSVRLLVDQGGQQRRERLIVLQTSVISALLTALTAVQALQFNVPLAKRLQGPVILTPGRGRLRPACGTGPMDRHPAPVCSLPLAGSRRGRC